MNTSTKIPMPKAAQQFIDDAKAEGFSVQVTHDSVAVSVYVERGETNGAAVWSRIQVWDSPMSGERLGFRTTPGRDAVRFDYGNSYSPYRGHQYHRSLRQVRGSIGLAI